MTTAFDHRWNVIIQTTDPGLAQSGAVCFQKPLRDVVPSPLPLPFLGAYLVHPTHGDLELLTGLLQSAYELEDAAQPALRLRLRDYFSTSTARPLLDGSWICFVDGTPVSACLISLARGTKTPHITDLMTAAPWQGHGLATVVLEKSFHALVEKGFSAVRLLCSDGTAPLVRHLKKIGFTAIGESA